MQGDPRLYDRRQQIEDTEPHIVITGANNANETNKTNTQLSTFQHRDLEHQRSSKRDRKQK